MLATSAIIRMLILNIWQKAISYDLSVWIIINGFIPIFPVAVQHVVLEHEDHIKEDGKDPKSKLGRVTKY